MKWRDLGRYAALIAGFFALEIVWALVTGDNPSPNARLSDEILAAMIVLLWAIREGRGA